jgi:hypothetical protein
MQQPTTPETGFLRIWQICGDKKRGVAPLIPISRSSWFGGVAKGLYPAGVLLSPGVRVWTAESIRGLISRCSTGDAA